jgi:hypothetical protein
MCFRGGDGGLTVVSSMNRRSASSVMRYVPRLPVPPSGRYAILPSAIHWYTRLRLHFIRLAISSTVYMRLPGRRRPVPGAPSVLV